MFAEPGNAAGDVFDDVDAEDILNRLYDDNVEMQSDDDGKDDDDRDDDDDADPINSSTDAGAPAGGGDASSASVVPQEVDAGVFYSVDWPATSTVMRDVGCQVMSVVSSIRRMISGKAKKNARRRGRKRKRQASVTPSAPAPAEAAIVAASEQAPATTMPRPALKKKKAAPPAKEAPASMVDVRSHLDARHHDDHAYKVDRKIVDRAHSRGILMTQPQRQELVSRACDTAPTTSS